MKVIQNLKNQRKSLKRHHILYIVLVLGLFLVSFNGSASAENINYQVNIDPALTVTVTSDGIATDNVTLNLNPMNHTFDHQSLDIKVATNNITGYQLFVSTLDSTTNLTSSDQAANVAISTLTSSTTDSTANSFETNKWGYKVTASDTNPSLITEYYNPFKLNTNLSTNHYATNGDTTTLDFAAKIDWNMPAGTYENTLVFTATATYAAYDISYYNGYDNSSTIATQSNSYNTSSTIKLAPGVTPTRPTYDFIKWCDQIPGANANNYFPATTCSGNSYNTGDTITIDPEDYNTNISLYAYWDPTTFEEAYVAAGITNKVDNYYTMQDMNKDICAAVTINEVTQLKDNRKDGSTTHNYYVAKLKDGKCWMTQNLRLGTNASSLTLTSAGSNVSSNFTMNKDENGKMPYLNIKDDRDGGSLAISGDPSASLYYCAPDSTNSNYYVGCYYNWYAATAGGANKNERVTPIGNGAGLGYVDVNSSVCPKNWYLPSGGGVPLTGSNSDRPDSDFNVLYNNYSSLDEMLVDNPTICNDTDKRGCDNTSGQPRPGFILGGFYSSIPAHYALTQGFYWSRSAYSNTSAYYLQLNINSEAEPVNPQGYMQKYVARSVRCVAYSTLN